MTKLKQEDKQGIAMEAYFNIVDCKYSKVLRFGNQKLGVWDTDGMKSQYVRNENQRQAKKKEIS